MPILEELIKTKPIQDPHQRAYLNIMYTGNWLFNRINNALKPFDLTEPQYNVLRILRGQNGDAMSLFEVQDRMIQKMSNVSRLIDKLLEKGWVARTECKDNRRKVDIRITDSGLGILDEVEPSLRAAFDMMDANLAAEEAATLATLLDTMRKDL
ncbi:MAG: MarR family transcriptional regulator [Sphingobacteriales bacterium]|nr:MAG: MarR family transcriptional regulator [Sphingobacteriales bacterium]